MPWRRCTRPTHRGPRTTDRSCPCSDGCSRFSCSSTNCSCSSGQTNSPCKHGRQTRSQHLRFDYSETDVVVNSDPALLERIVENLASDAIRYTTEGSVAIRVERIEDETQMIAPKQF
jgi:signal transduction histidine kinase